MSGSAGRCFFVGFVLAAVYNPKRGCGYSFCKVADYLSAPPKNLIQEIPFICPDPNLNQSNYSISKRA